MKKWLLKYIKTHWKLITFSILIVIVSAWIDVMPPNIVKKAIDSYITNTSIDQTQRIEGVAREAIKFLIVISSGFALNFLSLYISSYTGAKIVYEIRKDLYKHVLHLPMSFFDKNHSGVITTRITNDTQNLMEFFTTVITALVKDFFLIIGIVYMLVTMSAKLFANLSPVIIIVVVFTVIFRKYSRQIYNLIRSNIARINAFLAEHLAGMVVVQAFEVREVKKREFEEITEDYYKSALKQIKLYGFYRPLMDWLFSLGLAIIAWFGAKYVYHQEIGIGTLFAFGSYLDMFFGPIKDFAEKFDIAQSSLASADKIERILKETREHEGRGKKYEIQNGTIEFKDVWFAYEDENWVLKGINATFDSGGINAIVGETGAGKTSMLSLLNLTYRPQKGEILIDGNDIKEFDLSYLRRQIAVVPQEVILFSGTIIDNVRLFDDSIPEEEVVKALKKVHADEVFSRFSSKFHTMVTERGGNLSAGERQLIALARAILFNAKILILDEATASVDASTEARIQQTLEELSKERTVITIAHRLSTVKDAKIIYVLHKGEIVEVGTHQQLMDKRGFYYSLYSKMKEGASFGKDKDSSYRSGKDRNKETFGGSFEEF